MFQGGDSLWQSKCDGFDSHGIHDNVRCMLSGILRAIPANQPDHGITVGIYSKEVHSPESLCDQPVPNLRIYVRKSVQQ
jgi:hypothetical protein